MASTPATDVAATPRRTAYVGWPRSWQIARPQCLAPQPFVAMPTSNDVEEGLMLGPNSVHETRLRAAQPFRAWSEKS